MTYNVRSLLTQKFSFSPAPRALRELIKLFIERRRLTQGALRIMLSRAQKNRPRRDEAARHLCWMLVTAAERMMSMMMMMMMMTPSTDDRDTRYQHANVLC